ncbi:hypothetical protein C6500_10490 [Candidatus Poribacteria bacterium]|nr:MAG: hypothetical protein C6500_10490 [Candidatus Poribacteria bacterium]
MRSFGTQGRVRPEQHYIVPRTAHVADFVTRIRAGKYIVLFAPRQTGKTTFFRLALDRLVAEDPTYFPIQLNFEMYEDCTPIEFYENLIELIREEIGTVFQKREQAVPEALAHFLENTHLTNQLSMRRFFRQLAEFLKNYRVVCLIDEFDGIPQAAVRGFLHVLRHIYLTDAPQCPHSVGIVGVKSITQLNFDRSVSPFNIQDEFRLPNFTRQQVHELLAQYTEEVGQAFRSEVIESLHKQTAGQPFLVNRFAQILTDEMDIPKNEVIEMNHFATAHQRLLRERNTNIDHLRTNVRRDPRFEKLLMRIVSYENGMLFDPDDDLMNELVTYGVITEDPDGLCEIVNPIYQHRILQIFKPTVNGLENTYFSEDTGENFRDYLTPTGELEIARLLDNFQAFIARAGFRILQVPDTPQESVGQYLLYTYLDHFVRIVGADMFLEVQTGRGRIDLLLLHNQRKYIVETKIWEGNRYYQSGKTQLAAYLKLEGVQEGYYVVFDHRQRPEPHAETETIDGVKIRSYVIPVTQERPAAA